MNIRVREPSEDDIDLSRYAERVGLCGRFILDRSVISAARMMEAEDHFALMHSLAVGIDKALAGTAAGRAYFDFKHLAKRNFGSSKARPLKLRATMNVDGEGNPWVQLSLSPRQSRGRFHA